MKSGKNSSLPIKSEDQIDQIYLEKIGNPGRIVAKTRKPVENCCFFSNLLKNEGKQGVTRLYQIGLST